MHNHHLRDEAGQSLVQVLVSLGIMTILIAAMTSMYSFQAKENAALAEKVGSLDLARMISTSLTNGSICNALFAAGNLTNPASITFDASTVSPGTPYTLAVNQIPSGAAGAPIVAAGARASTLSSSLFVLPAGGAPPGIEIAVTGLAPPVAVLRVRFDPTRLTQPLGDLQFPISLTTTGPLNATTITGCSGANSGGNILAFSTPGATTFTVPAGVFRLEVEVWGGGGGGCGAAGGAGAGGGYSLCTMAVAPGAVFTVTVGAGGAAEGNWPACAANPGGTSDFTAAGYAPCRALGGPGGAAGGGGGGSGTTAAGPGILGFVNLSGGDGSDLPGCGPTIGVVARGGSSPRGGDGGGATGGGAALVAATAPGGGGAATCWAGAGFSGPGAAGAVHVRW